MFDADTFLNTTVEGASSTEYVMVPEDEYPAYVKDVKARSVDTKNGERLLLDVYWSIDDEGVKELTGRDENQVKQTVWLDLAESGGLAMGKGQNVQLGRLREAVGQNGPEAWGPTMLIGCPALVKVEHDGQYANVTEVTKA